MTATERYVKDGKTVTVRTRDDQVRVTSGGTLLQEITSTNAGLTARNITRNLKADGFQRKGGKP